MKTTLNKTIEINGRKIPAIVNIEVFEDDLPIEVDFGNTDEEKKYLARFESGELFSACIKVTACALGQVDGDSLSACHLHSNNAFESKFDDDLQGILEEHEMVENALENLKNTIIHQANKLAPYATKKGD